jgi:hypothetical protein
LHPATRTHFDSRLHRHSHLTTDQFECHSAAAAMSLVASMLLTTDWLFTGLLQCKNMPESAHVRCVPRSLGVKTRLPREPQQTGRQWADNAFGVSLGAQRGLKYTGKASVHTCTT